MKSTTFIICALFQFLVCTSLAFSTDKLRKTTIQKKYDHRRIPSTLPQWPTRVDENYTIRIRLSRLRMSKYEETVIEDEAIITKSPTITNGSADLSGERTSNNNEVNGSINGQTNGEIVNVNVLHNNERALGILVLLTVPLAWGTYTPVVKYMYEKMDPSMPGFVFSAGYYLVAAASLGTLSSMQDTKDASDINVIEKNGEASTMSDDEISLDQKENDDAAITKRGGWELGSYLFIGNGLQVVGLQTVPADRAGESKKCNDRDVIWIASVDPKLISTFSHLNYE